MNLQNCKVTIEPKDNPQMDVRFWDADISIDDSALNNPAFDENGELLLTIQLRVRPYKTRADNYCVGFIGDIKVVEP